MSSGWRIRLDLSVGGILWIKLKGGAAYRLKNPRFFEKTWTQTVQHLIRHKTCMTPWLGWTDVLFWIHTISVGFPWIPAWPQIWDFYNVTVTISIWSFHMLVQCSIVQHPNLLEVSFPNPTISTCMMWNGTSVGRLRNACCWIYWKVLLQESLPSINCESPNSWETHEVLTGNVKNKWALQMTASAWRWHAFRMFLGSKACEEVEAVLRPPLGFLWRNILVNSMMAIWWKCQLICGVKKSLVCISPGFCPCSHESLRNNHFQINTQCIWRLRWHFNLLELNW